MEDLELVVTAANSLLVRISFIRDELEQHARKKAVQELIDRVTLMRYRKLRLPVRQEDRSRASGNDNSSDSFVNLRGHDHAREQR